ncbi:MAG: hypothetical protein ABSC06_36690, partial [Rhodopila sp.]
MDRFARRNTSRNDDRTRLNTTTDPAIADLAPEGIPVRPIRGLLRQYSFDIPKPARLVVPRHEQVAPRIVTQSFGIDPFADKIRMGSV